MSTRKRVWTLTVLGVAAVLFAAGPVLAHCGSCPGDQKEAKTADHDHGDAQKAASAKVDAKAMSGKCGADCTGGCCANGATLAEVGKAAPLFVLADQDGEAHALKDLRGKIVVLEWVNWGCPFIVRHLKEETAKKLVQKYDGKEVVWLAVNSTSGTEPADDKKAVAEHKLPYDVLSDRDGRVGRLYGAKTTPDIRVIDAKGILVYAGGLDDDPRGNKEARTGYVDQALASLTSGKQVATAEAKPYGCSVKYAPTTLAPAFTLTDQEGKAHSLADYRGRVVVLEWTNWDCPFVKHQRKVGTTRTLAAEYKDQGIVWLLVNSTHTSSASQDKAKLDANPLGVPVLGDYDGAVGQAYGAKTTPHVFIVDPAGVIVYNGAIDDNPLGKKDQTTNYVRQALDELLAGKAISTPQTKPYGCSVKYAKPKQASAQ